MKIALLSGSPIGTKTRVAIDRLQEALTEQEENHEITLLDLRDLDIQQPDGRNYLDTEGDTLYLTTTLMEADIIFIGFPVFQAAIPGALKNVFDLLPVNAFRNKIAGLIVTAGSSKHYLIPELQLKPILGYMKAHVMQTYVFIEESDFSNKQIVNDDVHFRITTLAQDTLRMARVYDQILQEEDDQYDF